MALLLRFYFLDRVLDFRSAIGLKGPGTLLMGERGGRWCSPDFLREFVL